MSRCQPGSRLQVLSLDSGQAAAAAYLLLASPAKDTLNGPKTKRTARLRGLQPRGRILACPQFIFIPGGISNGK